jgi:hypothetical protein
MEDTKPGSSGQAAQDKQQGSSNEFMASTSFSGSRDGFIFTTGAFDGFETGTRRN